MKAAITKHILLQSKKSWLGFMLALVLYNGSHAQEVFSSGPAQLLTRFQFELLTGGVVIVKATIDQFPDSLHFILDTGSGGISLDSTTTERLKIATVPSDRTIRGIAGIKNVSFAKGRTLHLPGLNVGNLDFHINDYELLSGVYGIKIDGIIGFSFLRRYLVTLDYDKKMMQVYSPGDYRYPRGGYLLRPAITGLPMQYAWVEDHRSIYGRFYLDTGAGLNLLLSNEFAADSNLFSGSKRRYPTIAEGLGGKREMELAVLKSFKLGPFKFRKVPVYLFDDEYNVTAYPYLGGLIGNDILRRFHVVLNYPRSEIHLLPNSSYRDQFDYSFTGMGLYSENDVIVVTDVIPKSPAEKAGIQVGDIIIAVDNNLSNSMQTYRSILQQTGKKMKILLRRDRELIQTVLEVQTIKK